MIHQKPGSVELRSNTNAFISSKKTHDAIFSATSLKTIMKRILTLSAVLLALGGFAQAADTSVKLSNVHLCCNGCVKGVDKALSTVTGATAQSDKDAGTVTLSAPDNATAQKAVDALVAAG